ncbi:SET domain-containing protein [Rhynchospora pubera]|uniref:SET domain-containing protein n=1 Tax=Rhynchospora pubera TaxID=906938 RepID=A0AAV8H5H8_9POAL|nr:SET domain-containing protein [Rhynchospora pubera]
MVHYPVEALEHVTSIDKKTKLLEIQLEWERKAPSYLNKLVFPEEFMVTLRTISMKEFQIDQASSMSEVLEPSDKEVQAAIWEVCGDLGAFELLVDFLYSNEKEMRRHYWSSVVYRRGQKHLTKLFLREAQHALELCAQEQN